MLLKIFYFTYYYKLSQICHLMGHRWSLCDSWVMRTGVKETVVSIVVNSWAPAAPHSQHLLGHCQYYKNCEHLWWYCHTFIKRLLKRCHNFKTLPQKWWLPLWWNTVMKNWQVIYLYIYISHEKLCNKLWRQCQKNGYIITIITAMSTYSWLIKIHQDP